MHKKNPKVGKLPGDKKPLLPVAKSRAPYRSHRALYIATHLAFLDVISSSRDPPCPLGRPEVHSQARQILQQISKSL